MRSRRNEDELKAEMIELDAQLADMEEKCQPLWQELDGKLGVLEREIEYKRQEWESCGMRLCEEEKRIEWRDEAVQASEERLRPVQQELSEAQTAANEVRALLEAEQAIQEVIRKEMRETREQMQAKTREKEEFLARHVKDNHELMDVKAAQLAHIAHLNDTLQHNKNEPARLVLRQRPDDGGTRQESAAVEHAAGGTQRGAAKEETDRSAEEGRAGWQAARDVGGS